MSDEVEELKTKLALTEQEYEYNNSRLIKLSKYIQPAQDEDEWGMDVVDIAIKRLECFRRTAEAARGLVEYRKQAGAINFQLEKADYFINLLRIETEPK